MAEDSRADPVRQQRDPPERRRDQRHDQPARRRSASGSASPRSGRTDDEGLRRLAERPTAIARVVEELDDWGGLPEPDAESATSRPPTAGRPPAPTPEFRAEGVRAVIAAADDAGVTAYGSFATGTEIDRGRQLARRPGRRDADDVAAHHRLDGAGRRHRLRRGRGRRRDDDRRRGDRPRGGRARPARRRTRSPIEPGDYPVVLEEYAVVDLLDMLGYLGFSALAVQEERSFVEPGKRIGSDLVTIVDDGYDPAGPADVRSTTRASPSSGSPLVEARRLPRGRLRRPDGGPRRRRARPATACRPRTRAGPFPLNMVMDGRDGDARGARSAASTAACS